MTSKGPFQPKRFYEDTIHNWPRGACEVSVLPKKAVAISCLFEVPHILARSGQDGWSDLSMWLTHCRVLPMCTETLLLCVQMLNFRCVEVHSQNTVVDHTTWLSENKASVLLGDRTFCRNGNWGTKPLIIFLGVLVCLHRELYIDSSTLEFGISIVVSESHLQKKHKKNSHPY